MLGLITACLLSIQPLASVGTNNGVWFIGDKDPTELQFDPNIKGLDYYVCERNSRESYIPLQSLQRRPVAMLLHKNTVWLVDQGESVALFAMQKSNTGELKAKLQSVHKIKQHVTDAVSWNGSIAICFGGEYLQIVVFNGARWKELPLLRQADAQVTVWKDQLVAFSHQSGGVSQWNFENGNWVYGNEYPIVGELTDVQVKDDWKLLVSESEGDCHVVGIQQAKTVPIASFEIPRGRWSVLPSPEGLSALSVQRNGTVGSIDIGWPSGRIAPMLELVQAERSGQSFYEKIPIVLPMALILLLFFFRRRIPKNTNK